MARGIDARARFDVSSLQDLVPLIRGAVAELPEESEPDTKENEPDTSPEFAHFLAGLLNTSPDRRWESWQASEHPFITKADFTTGMWYAARRGRTGIGV